MQNLAGQIRPVKIRTVLDSKMMVEGTIRSLNRERVFVPVELQAELENLSASVADPTSYELIMAEAMMELERKLKENDAATEVKRLRIMEKISVINSVFDKLINLNREKRNVTIH